MKIIDTIWFTASSNTIGIVIGKDDTNEPKAYIGVGNGADEEVDTKHIVEWGAKLTKEIVLKLSNYFYKKGDGV